MHIVKYLVYYEPRLPKQIKKKKIEIQVLMMVKLMSHHYEVMKFGKHKIKQH